MKRFSAVRIFNNALEEGDIGLFIGKDVCKEAYLYDRPGNLYLPKYENMLSFGLGVAMCTEKRVFIFCEDDYFLRNIGEAAQIGVSKCQNIYLVILFSGIYSDAGGHPTIFDSISAPQGMLFNMGFLVHNYKRHFKNSKNPTKEINAIWGKIKGPLAVVLELDKGYKNIDDIFPPVKESLNRISEFIKNVDIPAYNYTPPIDIDESMVAEG